MLCCVIAVAASAEEQKTPAVQSTSYTETMPPSHWEYYRGSLESSIPKMYKSPLPLISPSSNHRALMLFRSYMLQTLRLNRGRIDIISVKQVENPLLYRRYITRRHEIALAAQGSERPLVEIATLTGGTDVRTNVNGKYSSSPAAICCFLVYITTTTTTTITATTATAAAVSLFYWLCVCCRGGLIMLFGGKGRASTS